eukprot:10315492-Alexandrium_andersonii.AAC.1
MELGRLARTHGSPAIWGCWRDEAENLVLKALAGRAHRAVWAARVLIEYAASKTMKRPRTS